MKTANPSTFGHKLARYPAYLRLQVQRRLLAMRRAMRSDPNDFQPSKRTSSGEMSEPDSAKGTFMSRDQRVWIFATVTGIVAIAMLVLQISATLSANAELAAREQSAAMEQQPPVEGQGNEPSIAGVNLTGVEQPSHVVEPIPFPEELPPHSASESHSDHSHGPSEHSPFALIPNYVDPAATTGDGAAVPAEDNALPEAPQSPAPRPTASDSIADNVFELKVPESFNPKAPARLDVDPQPQPTLEFTPEATVESTPEAKSESDPFSSALPALTAPDLHPQPVIADIPAIEAPADAVPANPVAAAPAPAVDSETSPDSNSSPADVPTPSPVLPDLDLTAPLDAIAPATPIPGNDSQHDRGLDFSDDAKPNPSPPDPATLPPAETPEASPARSPDTAIESPPAAEQAPVAPRARDNGDWTTADPAASGAPLVNPNLYRESEPVWRIVAPAAVAVNPIETPTADTARKELNITIIKTTPTKSSVNEIVSYEIIVRNNSQESVDGLILEERVPKSMQVADVNPEASFEQGTLHWTLSAFGPGEQRKLEVNLLATAAGDAEGLTSAPPVAAVTSNTDVQKPQVRLEISADEKVGQGQVCPISFRITNTGAETIENLVLRSVLPSQLAHRKGNSLDLVIDRLGPGESHSARLHPRAQRAGAARVTASIQIDGSSVEEADVNVEVVGSSHPALCP